MIKHAASLFLLLAFALQTQAWSYCDLEFAEIRVLEGKRSLEDIEEMRFGTFNVLNLEFSPGKYVDNPQSGVREFTEGFITKDPKQTEGVAKAILAEDLDLVILQEVEGLEPLLRFNEKYLKGTYEVFLQKGNDGRGIEIGFLVKKDLPFKIRMQGQGYRSYVNPETGKAEPIFSRDLPALHIRHKSTSMNDPPDFIVAGTHYKSQRNRMNDPRSEKMRTKQVEETREVFESYQETYPDVPIFFGGDFNADIHSNPEFRSLFEDGFMKDSFDLAPSKLSRKDRITHTFHPRNGATKESQLDAILVNESASSSILDAKVHRYLDENGKVKPLPATYKERETNPSDHFMVVIKTRISQLIGKKQ